VKVVVKIGKFVWQYIAIRYDVEFFFAKLFLHLHQVSDKSVFAS